MGGGIPILFINSLREGGPDVGHSISCTIVHPEYMQGLKIVMHKGFYFIIEATAFNCSRGVTINQFGDVMLRVSENKNLTIVFGLKNEQTLEQSQPFCFVIGPVP